MIITGMCCLATAAFLVIAGGVRASSRQLMAAAVFAVLGLAFVFAGGLVARVRRRQEAPAAAP
jgi:hypothetical protein